MKPTTYILFFFLLSLSGISCSSAQSHEGAADRNLSYASEDDAHGWLGIFLQNMTPKLAKKHNLNTDEGVRVMDVVEDSPAEKAGLKEGDIIVKMDGRRITDASDLRDEISAKNSGQSVTLTVVRDGKPHELTAVLGEMPERAEHMVPLPNVPPPILMFSANGANGLRLMELNDQLGKFFGAPDNRGVLVEEVRPGSSGDKAGFKAGDVIIRVGKDRIEDLQDLRSALWDYREGDSAQVEVIRKSSQLSLTLKVKDPGMKEYQFRSQRFGPYWHDRHFEWNSRDFNERMQEFGRRMDKFGKELEQRLKGIGEKIESELHRMEI